MLEIVSKILTGILFCKTWNSYCKILTLSYCPKTRFLLSSILDPPGPPSFSLAVPSGFSPSFTSKFSAILVSPSWISYSSSSFWLENLYLSDYYFNDWDATK